MLYWGWSHIDHFEGNCYGETTSMVKQMPVNSQGPTEGTGASHYLFTVFKTSKA